MRSATSRHRCARLLVVAAVMVGAGCGGSKSLATQVDDLLRVGKVAEANRKLAQELPGLVQAGKTAEADEVAAVVRQYAGRLPPPDAASIRRNSVESYFEGVAPSVENVPLDDICEAVVTLRPQPGAGATLDEFVQYAREQERRESAAAYCKLLGLDF